MSIGGDLMEEFYEDQVIPPLKRRIADYENILISLHTYRWTGDQKKFAEMMDAIAAFSYARTNSNLGETDKEVAERCERTFQKLLEI